MEGLRAGKPRAWRNSATPTASGPATSTSSPFEELDLTTKHEQPKLAFSIDDLRLVSGIKPDRPRVSIDQFPAVSTVVARMKARQSVSLLALGDSITWGTSVRGNANAYPAVPRLRC